MAADRRRKKRAPRLPAAVRKRIAELEGELAQRSARVVELESTLARPATLGAVPVGDPLAGFAWLARAWLEQANEVIADPTLKPKERRAELHKITASLKSLKPEAEIQGALDEMRGANQQLEKRRAGPQMTDAPDLSTAAAPVAPRRGRPPGRSLR